METLALMYEQTKQRINDVKYKLTIEIEAGHYWHNMPNEGEKTITDAIATSAMWLKDIPYAKVTHIECLDTPTEDTTK